MSALKVFLLCSYIYGNSIASFPMSLRAIFVIQSYCSHGRYHFFLSYCDDTREVCLENGPGLVTDIHPILLQPILSNTMIVHFFWNY